MTEQKRKEFCLGYRHVYLELIRGQFTHDGGGGVMLGSVFVVGNMPETRVVGCSTGDKYSRVELIRGGCSGGGPNGTTATSVSSSPAWGRTHLTQFGEDLLTGASVGTGEIIPRHKNLHTTDTKPS